MGKAAVQVLINCNFMNFIDKHETTEESKVGTSEVKNCRENKHHATVLSF